MQLGIFHLERTDKTDYDQTVQVVVIDTDEQAARERAAGGAGTEGGAVWLSSLVRAARIGIALDTEQPRVVVAELH